MIPEYLLCGQLIDRAGMPHAIGAFGREVMQDIAIEEWMAASPVYSKRMQRALRFESDTVETIFKNIQIDVGAPPQFLDFRFRLDTPYRGEFWLDHCGALVDVEPMGEEYVYGMCHDIEDPTFDATATATNPKAQVRPIHRPPRTPADRHPHCAWTVVIDDSHPELPVPEGAIAMWRTAAAAVEFADPDPNEPGLADYSGPLLSDLRFADWSHSALRRIACEIFLQWHFLALGFRAAIARRLDDDATVDMARHQFAGIAGVAADRLRRALDLPPDEVGLASVLALHPALLPAAYVDATVDGEPGGSVTLRLGRADGATVDGAWVALLDADHVEPLDAIARGVSPDLGVVGASEERGALVVRFGRVPERPESSDVAMTRFSTGVEFAFEDRGTPVELRPATGDSRA